MDDLYYVPHHNNISSCHYQAVEIKDFENCMKSNRGINHYMKNMDDFC